MRDVLTARYDVARGSQDRPTFAVQAATAAAADKHGKFGDRNDRDTGPDTAGIANAFAAAVPTLKAGR